MLATAVTAHAIAGNVEVDQLTDWAVEFTCWCNYKYMEAHDMLQAAHDTIDRMLLETVAVASGKEQGVDITDVMLS